MLVRDLGCLEEEFVRGGCGYTFLELLFEGLARNLRPEISPFHAFCFSDPGFDLPYIGRIERPGRSPVRVLDLGIEARLLGLSPFCLIRLPEFFF